LRIWRTQQIICMLIRNLHSIGGRLRSRTVHGY